MREGITFVLGHALYMKAIHGGKAKNDKIDSKKIAFLLRGGNIPFAYVYPPEMRATRDLLRRRNFLMHKRAELLTHIEITNAQYNLPPFGKKLAIIDAAALASIGAGGRIERRELAATGLVALDPPSDESAKFLGVSCPQLPEPVLS